MLECKTIGAGLEANYAGQLYRYFSVTDARFGVLTDGIRYLFFSDIDKENKMDDRPFFEFNLLQFGESQVEELKKFAKTSFNLETIISTASNLKYHKELVTEIRAEFESPSEEMVRLLAGRVHSGRYTQQVKEQFTGLVQKAMRDFVRDQVNDRLKTALETDKHEFSPTGDAAAEPFDEQLIEDSGIETTSDELDAHRIIQAIGAELIDPERITMRDAKSYCAILFDDNNRRPICRLFFSKNKMRILIFTPVEEVKFDLEKVTNIYRYRELIKEAINQYEKKEEPLALDSAGDI